MNKKVLMGLVLLTLVGSSMVFAQVPTLDKLQFSNLESGAKKQVRAVNTSISGEVVIPATWEGAPVVGVGSPYFRNCTAITSVVIPASFNNILATAFEGCTSLTSVTFLGTTSITNSNSFPGDLRAKYLAANGGPGTYTRQRGSDTWTKQAGRTICPHCNGTGFLD